MKLGMIVRADNTGLGNQTYELTQMLNPHKIMIIDFTFYNGNQQHFGWYAERDYTICRGVPSDEEMNDFLDDIDVLLSCETFYNDDTPTFARAKGVKTYLQYNYELFGNLRKGSRPLADVLISPSPWMIDKVNKKFRHYAQVFHIPPPTRHELFERALETNISKDHKRMLHIAGKAAANDRNGTESVLEMMRHSKADFELVIKSQTPISSKRLDSRITVEINNVKHRQDMYTGFDGMILPRRYAGLCLPMNEALLSGLPVFMTDISPNNFILPKEWLTVSEELGVMRLATPIIYYDVNPKKLAENIDYYIGMSDKKSEKQRAFDIGYKSFSPNVLKSKYLEILGQ
jgi:glycosyltransferase involved in cell wall biosynthesis